MAKTMVSWQAFPSLPSSSRAPRVSLAPKPPFPSLSNACHAGYMTTNLCHLTFMVDHDQTIVDHCWKLCSTMVKPWLAMVYSWFSRRGNLGTFPKQISGKFKTRRVAYINIDVSMVTESL